MLPPHASAIGILFYTGAMFPQEYRSRALIALHGYRAMGHRVVSVPFTPDGDVAGPPEDLVGAWEERPGRPHGHLTSLAQLADGSVLLSDDVGGTVYRIAWGESATRAPPPPPPPPPEPQAAVDARCAELTRQRALFARVQREVLDARCVPCHANAAGAMTLRRCDWRGSWETLVHGRSTRGEPMVVPGDIAQGELMARLRGEAPLRMPPPGVVLTDAERALLERWVREGATPP